MLNPAVDAHPAASKIHAKTSPTATVKIGGNGHVKGTVFANSQRPSPRRAAAAGKTTRVERGAEGP